MDQPLIVTLQLDERAQALYDDLRGRYFPAARNFIPAHVTLFHQLPDEEATYRALEEMARATPMLRLTEPTVRSIGRGVAVFYECAELGALHARLAEAFREELIPQDRQRLRPHIVIQNKVDAERARQTLVRVKAETLVEAYGVGLRVWRYLGGPWERVGNFEFEAGRGGFVTYGVGTQWPVVCLGLYANCACIGWVWIQHGGSARLESELHYCQEGRPR